MKPVQGIGLREPVGAPLLSQTAGKAGGYARSQSYSQSSWRARALDIGEVRAFDFCAVFEGRFKIEIVRNSVVSYLT